MRSFLHQVEYFSKISEHYSFLFQGGFTKSGHPLLILPDNHLFFEVVESDLHLLLKYFISIIPMAKQVRSDKITKQLLFSLPSHLALLW